MNTVLWNFCPSRLSDACRYWCHMGHCKISEHSWDQCVHKRAETCSESYESWLCIAEAHAFAGQCQSHTMRLGSSWWMLSSATTLYPRTWQSMLWATVSIILYFHSCWQSTSCMLHCNLFPSNHRKIVFWLRYNFVSVCCRAFKVWPCNFYISKDHITMRLIAACSCWLWDHPNCRQ